MNTNMSVVYITTTGHVVGAVTCNSNPARSLTAVDIATPTFLVAQPDDANRLHTFALPLSVISVSPPATYSRDLFSNPAAYALSGSTVQVLNANTSPPTLRTTFLDVAIPGAVASDTMVFAQIQSLTPPFPAAQTCVITGKIPAGSMGASFSLSILPGGAPISLTAGSYYSVILLVAGRLPLIRNLLATNI